MAKCCDRVRFCLLFGKLDVKVLFCWWLVWLGAVTGSVGSNMWAHCVLKWGVGPVQVWVFFSFGVDALVFCR